MRRNRTLIAASTSIVWSADGKGNFSEDQPSWAAFTGQQRSDYQGSGWRAAFEAHDQNRIEIAWARAVNFPEIFDLELRLWHGQSARHRYVSIRAVPVMESSEKVNEWIGTVNDVDDQRRAEDELRQLNAELERRVTDRTAELESAISELEGFSYSVSHDLRAPVRAISGFSKLLWEDHADQLNDEAKRKLGFIQSESLRMGVLIDDLLAFSRLGRQSVQRSDLDMTALANGTFERLQTHHEGPKPEFRLGSLPHANGDRVLLEQVWVNLLSNALKFSARREKPAIEVGAISEEKEHVYFVRDNGAGFNPRYSAKLFGVFQRLHDAAEFAGTGIGLALVSRIVTRHGGRVWADGKPNEGATFYFTIPKERASGIS